ncbi:unnamed protein product, partial [marine sediment metagenome]
EVEAFEESEEVLTFYEAQHETGEKESPEGGGNDMDEKEVQKAKDDAVKEALDKQRAEFSKSLGIEDDADPVKGAEALRKADEAKQVELTEREAKEFAAKVDAQFLQAVSEEKKTPAMKDDFMLMVEGLKTLSGENGTLKFTVGKEEKTGTVLEALDARVKAMPKIQGLKLSMESGEQTNPAEREKKKVSDHVPRDVREFAKELGIPIEGVEEFEEIKNLAKKEKISFEQAMCEVT